MTIHTNLDQAFQKADVIILLDEWWSDDGDAEDEEDKKKKKVKGISDRYREYGHLIDKRANKEVKVIVSGDSFVNLRCSLLLDNARSIDSHQFVTMATQLENEARALVAKKLKVRTSGNCDKLVVWWGRSPFPDAFWHFPCKMILSFFFFCSRCYTGHCVGKHQW